MLLLTSVLCVVLSLELGVATPKGNRLKESNLQNEGNNEFNVERNTGEPTNSFNTPNNKNEHIYPENQRNVFMNNEDYENYANNNPAAYRNRNKKQPSVISESKDYNQNNADRNFNNFNEDSYIASLPQVNRMKSFRSKGEVNNEANISRKVDILSEVNNPNSDSPPMGPTPQIIQKRHHPNQIMNKYNSQKTQTPKKLNDKKEEEEETLSDVPVATPEYIKSLYNEDNQTKKNNFRPTMTNTPRNNISNKSFKQNSQNINEATFQNPSAEILYESGQAKPYEISNEPLINSRQGHTNTQNILRDKQRLKNLYLSSKPTKHYMIVYPDGRVEQVDNLDKIQKVHRNYVMLNAKELLQHNPNVKNTASQRSVVRQNVMTTTNSNKKTQFNSIKVTKDEKIEKATQTVNKQTLPVQSELPVATESPNILTTEVSTDNVVTSSEDQLKEDDINDSEEKNKLNSNNKQKDNENTNSGAILTTYDNSNNEVSTTCTTETPDTDDIVTTARSTLSTAAPDTVILNSNNSLSTSNNTDNPNLSKEPEASNTSGDNLKNTKDGNVLAEENTTPKSKIESNEDKSVKNTTTLMSAKENNNTTDRIETVNVNNETISNSSSLYSSVNSKESNSSTKSNDETVVTSKDGTDSHGNTFHIETIVTNNTNESSKQNLESNNATSSNSSTLVTNSNTTEIENSTTENTQNNINPLNVTSSNSLTKKDENNTDTTNIQILSNNTNSELNGTRNDDNNLKPHTLNNTSDSIYTNASSSNTTNEAKDVNSVQEESNSNKTITNIKQDDSKPTNDDTGDSEALPNDNPDVSKEEDRKTVTGVSNGGKVSSNEEDSSAPGTASNDLYYLNSPQVDEDDEDDDTVKNDNLDEESPSSDGTVVKESSFWFKANESFWNKLMNGNDHNSFYFLFPRPQPIIKETKKIIYPNGTVVVETTETIDNGDGETNSTKTVVTCGNCTSCDKTS